MRNLIAFGRTNGVDCEHISVGTTNSRINKIHILGFFHLMKREKKTSADFDVMQQWPTFCDENMSDYEVSNVHKSCVQRISRFIRET